MGVVFYMKVSIYRPHVGKYESIEAITHNQCNRCGGNITYELSELKERYCRNCLPFGMVSERSKLYLYSRDCLVVDHQLTMSFELTSSQKQASDFLMDCYKQKKNGILQAVCGAGKTEMLYQVILYVLKEQARVCIAIPRKDIVHELTRRLQVVFPNTVVKCLSEDYKEDDGAHLVLSTVHQLIHFYQEFDLIIVDEADAFPYKDNELLERFIQKSKRLQGIIIKMTATMSSSLKMHQKANQIPYFYIPVRFHQHVQDIPQLTPMKETSTTTLDSMFVESLRKQNTQHRFTLIFVPSIHLCELLKLRMQEHQFLVECVHSKSKNRFQLIELFSSKKVAFLISTSILERGVTFEDIDVFVYQADASLFDKDTLVQMAGRVGRSAIYPTGKIIFFAKTKSRAMMEAINQLKKANHLAKKQGLILG
jgi:competence protein ComFA